jgi:large-conductance mechanosensitive channel
MGEGTINSIAITIVDLLEITGFFIAIGLMVFLYVHLYNKRQNKKRSEIKNGAQKEEQKVRNHA